MNQGQMYSELQQLRKEVNELRERIIRLETRPNTWPPVQYPNMPFRPYEITCKDGSVITITSPIVAQNETSAVSRSESGLL